MYQVNQKFKIRAEAKGYEIGEIVEVSKVVYGYIEVTNGKKKMYVPKPHVWMYMVGC